MNKHKFTLIELLMVIAVIVMLCGLLLPALRSAREQAKQIQCASNLKQCGYAMSAYASDFNGFVVLHLYHSTNSGYAIGQSARWLDMLDGKWNVEYMKDGDVALCPSFTPFKYTSSNASQIYGARLNSFPNVSAEVIPSGYAAGATKVVSLPKLSSPSKYFMLGDSYSPGSKTQVYVVSGVGVNINGLQLRHHFRGNILSGDFHVESADRVAVKNWSIMAGYINETLITF